MWLEETILNPISQFEEVFLNQPSRRSRQKGQVEKNNSKIFQLLIGSKDK